MNIDPRLTYLPTQVRGSYFYLYLSVDLFSRKVVGWQVYDCESAELASTKIRYETPDDVLPHLKALVVMKRYLDQTGKSW